MNQATAAATAGLGTGLLALGGAITNTSNAKGSVLAGVPSTLAFDLTAYTQLLQQMAAKMYPYDPASIAASLAALTPAASHLPLALTATHALSLTANKASSKNSDKATNTSACLPSNGDFKIVWTPEKNLTTKVKEEDGETALDLRTQGLK